MSDTASLLESLRDVREPLPPEGVPLWLLLANFLALTIVVILLWHLRKKHRYGWRKQLLDDLRKAQKQPPEQAIVSAATVLRQLSLARGHPVQTVHGEPWLHHLDHQFNTQWFTQEEGRLLGDALYRPETADNITVTVVLKELEKLIISLPAQPHLQMSRR